MCINGNLMTFSKTKMGNQSETFNGSSYVKLAESGRISFSDYVMYVYVHLTEKMKW